MATTAPPSQATHLARFECVLGPDVLLLKAFSGTEGVCMPYRYRIDLLSTKPDLDPEELLLTEASLLLDIPGGVTRKIHGVIIRFCQGGVRNDKMTVYRAELGPPLLAQTGSFRSRVYQNQTVPQIVDSILDSLQVEHEFELPETETYPKLEYCVQYRETDLNFVSRLLEDEGIFYFFRHEPTRVLLVMTDSNISIKQCPGRSTIRVSAEAALGEDIITHVRREWGRSLGVVNLRTYDELQPSLDLEVNVPGDGIKGAWYDYHPRRYTTFEEGERYARFQLEADEALRYVLKGKSTARNFQSGSWFNMDRGAGTPTKYILTSVKHKGKVGEYRADSEYPEDFEYSNTFTCIPHGVPYRPLRNTPRPVVRGCQTAVVVGKEDEEIYVDKHGRVKVQFHWDRLGEKDQNSSCWVRVGTPWAGKHWGMIHIPRIDQEVIVDFLEGDPDHPIIIGSVYNAEQMPPYPLPDHHTRSGVKSRSTPDGSPGTFNEIRFEDKRGAEHIRVHAERNLRVHVENNDVRSVGRHSLTKISGARGVLIEGEAPVEPEDVPEDGEVEEGPGETVSDVLQVANNRVVLVGGDETHEVEGSLRIATGPNAVSQLLLAEGRDQGITCVGEEGWGSQVIMCESGRQSIGVKRGSQLIWVENGDQTVQLQAGNRSVEVMGKIDEWAMRGIELKVGENSIKIDQTGVTIKGITVKVEGQIMTEVKGLMTNIEGDAMLTAQGGVIMIG